MKRTLFVLVFTITMRSFSATQSESCSVVMRIPASSIAFLEEQKAARQSPCITSVIKQLGRVHEVGAIHVLASYLDFVDPATLPQPDGFSVVRPVYPAVDALFLIGKPATPELLSLIKEGGSPKSRRKAAEAYQAIYRNDLASGIRLLKKEEWVADSRDSQTRLREAIKMLIDDCNGRREQEKQACVDADRGD